MTFTPEQRKIISDALLLYKGEIDKLRKKADKLGRKEGPMLKSALLEVEALRGQLDR